MIITPNEDYIPGTILRKSAMGNVTGMDFLDKIFYISQGIMLSQIRQISGIDGSTLQNWTKRGWVSGAKCKKYDKEQVARILIINMLRDCMQLDRIAFLLRYINGEPRDGTDTAIISEAQLYDYICRIIDMVAGDRLLPLPDLRGCIEEALSDYSEKFSGARLRLCRALEIMIIAYSSAQMKNCSDRLVTALTEQ